MCCSQMVLLRSLVKRLSLEQDSQKSPSALLRCASPGLATSLQVDPSVSFDQVGGLDHYINALKVLPPGKREMLSTQAMGPLKQY